MKCRECGVDVPADDATCPQCGAENQTREPVGVWTALLAGAVLVLVMAVTIIGERNVSGVNTFAPNAAAEPMQAVVSPPPPPSDYSLVGEPENTPSASAPRRYAVRITVPYGKSRDELQSLLERVAREQQRSLNANALLVFAYRPGEPATGLYTAGRALIAPYGNWSRAGEDGPLQVSVELQDAYFTGGAQGTSGTTKRLVSSGATQTVYVSRRFESWHDDDIVAKLPAGTSVKVLETRTSGPYVTRLRIRAKYKGRVVEGWIHSFDAE